MTNLFRNSSPGALTMAQAIALEKKRLAERRRQKRLAEELAAQGRGEDTEIAHLTPGEIVVPEALQRPEFMAALRRAAADQGISLDTLCIGNAKNSINPDTGVPEFGLLSGFGDWFSRTFGSSDAQAATAPTAAPSYVPPADPGMGTTRIPIPTNDVQLDSGIVHPPYSTPTGRVNVPPYDPRLVPNREKDLQIPEVKAFLDTISQSEGAGFHTVLSTDRFPTGRLAPDISQFPNRGPDNRKTASGAYQIQEDVYDDLASQMGLQGFGPETQRLMAAQLLQRAVGGVPGTESALEALRRGDYDKAIEASRFTWTSLPGGKEEKNRHITPDELRSYYKERLKLYRPQQR
jgi:muramidase (phage lysozyme)